MAKRRHPPAKKPQKKPSPLPPEIRGIPLLAFALLSILSLISFQEGRPSQNWLGLAGYTVAFALTYGFGLASYCLSLFCGWVGWRFLLSKPLPHLKLKTLFLCIFLLSSCVLLNLAAEVNPRFAAFFQGSVYSESLQLPPPLSFKKVRFNLGGVPFYYLLRDMPWLNFQHLLSNVGTFLVFFTTLTVSGLQLAKAPLMRTLELLLEKLAQARESSKEKKRLRTQDALLKAKIGQPAPGKSAVPKERTPFGLSPLLNIKEKLAAKAPKSETPRVSMAESLPRAVAEPKTAKPLASTPQDKRVRALQAQALVNGDMTHYQIPPLSLLQDAKKVDQSLLKKDLLKLGETLEETLLSFGIEAKVGHIQCGPTITSFEVHPAIGVKVQKIKALENDIALNLKAKSLRIIAPIPGKAAVGVEVPNPIPQEVSFKEMLASYQQSGRKAHIPVLLGKIVNVDDLATDLAKMPHCILAGATGSGKSVCINTIVMSILMTAKPDEIKLLMVDPKKVELTAYSRLPHMIAPVITEPHGACAALNWLVKEMERRYEMLKQVGARNIVGFNHRPASAPPTTPDGLEIPKQLPYIVAIIDELADLMMVSSQDIETPIARIAQMARAVGIHLILATQRPSREVITGLIKANFPTRIAFKVASRINSQIILDEIGAESLLGNGDMLFLPPGSSTLLRAQGAFIRDEDINRVVDFIAQQAPPHYLIPSFDTMNYAEAQGGAGGGESVDSLYDSAKQVVVEAGTASTTFLQRKLKIGYARAASIMDQLFQNGVIGPQEGAKPRKVLQKGSRQGASEEDDFMDSL